MFSSLVLLGGIVLFSSAAAQKVWPVTVGDATGDTIFTPNNINALVGDTVQFTFNPKNHSVTQSTLASPCNQFPGGFDTGFNPVAVGTASNFPTFTITVNDTKPIWAYCRQGENTPASHCGKGMVFAVNPGANGTSNSFAAFQAAAEAIGAALSSSTSSFGTMATGPSTSSETVSKSEVPPSSTTSSKSNGATSLVVEGSFLTSAIAAVLWLM